ncbi:MAG: serine/threonine protein kinase, partial [Myxococcales bacterium]|nr:serine/threonine protein kinase [Myxococcales bacterium]
MVDDAAGLLDPGTTMGNYQIEEVLGVGGIGEVYLADHVKLGRKVALKRLRTEYSSNREVVSRFFDEARAANQIAHENIVEITDFVEDPVDGAYLIMELLRGEDLGMVLEREESIPADRTVAIMRQVASALAAAHRVGVVHRDLKPDNVFLTE